MDLLRRTGHPAQTGQLPKTGAHSSGFAVLQRGTRNHRWQADWSGQNRYRRLSGLSRGQHQLQLPMTQVPNETVPPKALGGYP